MANFITRGIPKKITYEKNLDTKLDSISKPSHFYKKRLEQIKKLDDQFSVNTNQNKRQQQNWLNHFYLQTLCCSFESKTKEWFSLNILPSRDVIRDTHRVGLRVFAYLSRITWTFKVRLLRYFVVLCFCFLCVLLVAVGHLERKIEQNRHVLEARAREHARRHLFGYT